MYSGRVRTHSPRVWPCRSGSRRGARGCPANYMHTCMHTYIHTYRERDRERSVRAIYVQGGGCALIRHLSGRVGQEVVGVNPIYIYKPTYIHAYIHTYIHIGGEREI